MHKFLVNIRYFLTPALIVLSLLGVLLGGPWVWLGVALFIGSMIVDSISSAMPGIHCEAAGRDDMGETYGISGLLKAMMWAQYPIFVALQLALIWRVYGYVNEVPTGTVEFLGLSLQTGVTGWELIGATISAGLYLGLGIMFGHELAHTKGPTFVLARWMMALSGISHFLLCTRI